MDYNEMIDSFRKLSEDEKKLAIEEFIENNIKALSNLNKNIGNNKPLSKTNIDNDDELDTIYELLHVMTNELSSFAEYVENKFYE